MGALDWLEPEWAVIVIYAVGGVVVLAVIIGIILCCVYSKRRRQVRRRDIVDDIETKATKTSRRSSDQYMPSPVNGRKHDNDEHEVMEMKEFKQSQPVASTHDTSEVPGTSRNASNEFTSRRLDTFPGIISENPDSNQVRASDFNKWSDWVLAQEGIPKKQKVHEEEATGKVSQPPTKRKKKVSFGDPTTRSMSSSSLSSNESSTTAPRSILKKGPYLRRRDSVTRIEEFRRQVREEKRRRKLHQRISDSSIVEEEDDEQGSIRRTRRVSFRGDSGRRETRTESYDTSAGTQKVRNVLERKLSNRISRSELRDRKILLHFDDNVDVHEITGINALDRKADPTWAKLTPQQKLDIRKELNVYKSKEMEVHEESKQFVRLHPNTKMELVLRKHFGSRVRVNGYGWGTLRYFGPHHTRPGMRAGVELDDAIGKNNGTVEGYFYFASKPDHGVLLAPVKVMILQEAGKLLLLTQVKPDTPIWIPDNPVAASEAYDAKFMISQDSSPTDTPQQHEPDATPHDDQAQDHETIPESDSLASSVTDKSIQSKQSDSNDSGYLKVLPGTISDTSREDGHDQHHQSHDAIGNTDERSEEASAETVTAVDDDDEFDL